MTTYVREEVLIIIISYHEYTSIFSCPDALVPLRGVRESFWDRDYVAKHGGTMDESRIIRALRLCTLQNTF